MMQESLPRQEINARMAMEPSELGRCLTLQGTGRCPFHPGVSGPMAVHENGVQFTCGCCRRLPPLHQGVKSWTACKLCNRGIVIPIRRRSRTAEQELAFEYAGLG